MRDLNQKQFKNYSLEFINAHKSYSWHSVVASTKRGNEVGVLQWNKKTGEIHKVEVDKSHRRKGVATAMLNFGKTRAKSTKTNSPSHSSSRSKAGDAWAQSADKNVVKLKKGQHTPDWD